jgi:hypothetical protein
MAKKDLSIEAELEALGKTIDNMSESLIEQSKMGLKRIALETHAFITDKATHTLHSSLSTYMDALKISSENDSVWVVYLQPEANWIEDGQPAHDMIEALTHGPKSKVGKDGKRYAIIPFKHNKRPQDMSRAEMQLAEHVKSELKKLKLNKTILDDDGKPKLGKVAAATVDMEFANSIRSKIPLLAGVNIYQREVQMKNGKTKVMRDIFTFRVVSEKQKGTGKWWHPGTKPLGAFKEAEAKIDALWSAFIQEMQSKT